MKVMSKETFGPVMIYNDIDEAIRYAKDTPYGLGGVLFTRDAVKVKTFFEEVNQQLISLFEWQLAVN